MSKRDPIAREILRRTEAMRTERRRLRALEKRRATMIEYLRLRIDLADWHGVMDAAADIREIESEMRVIREWGADVVISGSAAEPPDLAALMRQVGSTLKRRG